jgi:D-glycero-alpha-D-manno-heptose-7-phosphate kinase
MADRRRQPDFVLTRTPLRISFAGGGTDLPEFYRRDYGAVLSTSINKFVYVTIKRHHPMFGENYRLNYFESEHVNDLNGIRNEIMRECLRMVPVDPPLYISTVGDLPSSAGLGSSSSFAVGMLNALYAMRGERVSPIRVCEQAAEVEISVLKHPIGKQDHAAAAFGGMNYIRFHSDERVTIEPINLSLENLRLLFDQIQFYWTGLTRDSASVLTEQRAKTQDNLKPLQKMRDLAERLREAAQTDFDVGEFGRIMHEGWGLKRELASGVSSPQIDRWCEAAITAGATGVKIAGAGGGGFLLLIVPPEKQASVRSAMNGLTEVSIAFEPRGSHVLMPAQE